MIDRVERVTDKIETNLKQLEKKILNLEALLRIAGEDMDEFIQQNEALRAKITLLSGAKKAIEDLNYQVAKKNKELELLIDQPSELITRIKAMEIHVRALEIHRDEADKECERRGDHANKLMAKVARYEEALKFYANYMEDDGSPLGAYPSNQRVAREALDPNNNDNQVISEKQGE